MEQLESRGGSGDEKMARRESGGLPTARQTFTREIWPEEYPFQEEAEPPKMTHPLFQMHQLHQEKEAPEEVTNNNSDKNDISSYNNNYRGQLQNGGAQQAKVKSGRKGMDVAGKKNENASTTSTNSDVMMNKYAR